MKKKNTFFFKKSKNKSN